MKRPCSICLHHPDEHKNGVCNACDPTHVLTRPDSTKISKSNTHKKMTDPNIDPRHEYIELPSSS